MANLLCPKKASSHKLKNHVHWEVTKRRSVSASRSFEETVPSSWKVKLRPRDSEDESNRTHRNAGQNPVTRRHIPTESTSYRKSVPLVYVIRQCAVLQVHTDVSGNLYPTRNRIQYVGLGRKEGTGSPFLPLPTDTLIIRATRPLRTYISPHLLH